MIPKIVLASSSKRRKKLISLFGYKYKFHPSNISEDILENETPKAHVARLACEKVFAISNSYKNKNVIIVGADTIVVLNSKIINKPKSKSEAVKILLKLSGKKHTVYTGIAVLNSKNNKFINDVVSTDVYFRKLALDEIKKYVATGSPMDKSGAYGIQDDFGALFVKKINGCFYNVVGLPLVNLQIALNKILK